MGNGASHDGPMQRRLTTALKSGCPSRSLKGAPADAGSHFRRDVAQPVSVKIEFVDQFARTFDP